MNLKRWMGDIAGCIGEKKISEIVIPGSHDSGSYCIDAASKRTDSLPDIPCINPLIDIVGALWSKTQDFSIQDQLEMGIRYIDIRVYLDKDDDNFYLVHGFEAQPLFTELTNIAQFMKEQPTEFVVLDMNHIYNCDNTQLERILDKFQLIFGEQLCPPSPADTSVPTYNELIASGKRVIVAVSEKPECFKSSYRHRCTRDTSYPWIWSSETNIVSPWADTTNVPTLYAFLKETMTAPRAPNSMHVTQTILTPQTSDTILGLFRPPSNLRELAEKLRPHLADWFEEFTAYQLNIAIVDFQDSLMIERLVKLNIPPSMRNTVALQRVTTM